MPFCGPEKLRVNAQPVEHQDYLRFPIEAGTRRSLRISFETSPQMVARPHGLYSVECGSLVFALPLEYRKIAHEYVRDGVERRFPYCDYEYRSSSEWRYGFSDSALEKEYHGLADCPFSSENPALTVKAKLRRIDWDYEDGFDTAAAKLPADRHPQGPEESLSLFPYGCAKLRMTELPFCEE